MRGLAPTLVLRGCKLKNVNCRFQFAVLYRRYSRPNKTAGSRRSAVDGSGTGFKGVEMMDAGPPGSALIVTVEPALIVSVLIFMLSAVRREAFVPLPTFRVPRPVIACR